MARCGSRCIARTSTPAGWRPSRWLVVAAWLSTQPALVPILAAQGIAFGSITGRVLGPDGAGLDGAVVEVLNTSTGVLATTRVHGDRFVFQGLEPGTSYVIHVRQVGYAPQRSPPIALTLGEPLHLQFVLQPTALQIEAVEVSGLEPVLRTGGGAAATIPEATAHRLPTLNRNVYDFVVLAPQVSTKVGSGRNGVSAAGSNLRFNSFLINGVEERAINGSVSTAASVGKAIPLEAVREYQVLVAPYDVRYGGFAGAMVNTVTYSGTNAFHGSGFTYWRSDDLAGGPADQAASYRRLQYGFSLGGPILRDRIHFFVAPEIQALDQPAAGAYLGQPAQRLPAVPVAAADVERFAAILRERYGLAGGTGGAVENQTPLVNLFARLDAAIPRWNSRLSGFLNYARRREDLFARTATDTFPLSSYQFAPETGSRLASFRLQSDLPGVRGGRNQLVVSLLRDWVDQVPSVRAPLVRTRVPGLQGGTVSLTAGTAAQAQGRYGRGRSLTVRDEMSLLLGPRHLLALGLELERLQILRGGVNGGYGVWSFDDLDALEQGHADRYELRKDFGTASTPLHGGQYAAYLGDAWRVSDRLGLTLGLRADLLAIDGHAPYNAMIDSIFARRTDQMPRSRVHLSPRLGFEWDLSVRGRHRLYGGAGLFTGRPPLAWYVPGLANYGERIAVLACGFLPGDLGAPPAFEPDYRDPPTRCATGPPLEARRDGDVDLLDPNLRLAQSLRSSVGYERDLPGGIFAAAELLVTREVAGFQWVNLNLREPRTTDRFGRVLYGLIGTNGVPDSVTRSSFAGVIELRNTSRNYSYQASVRLERRSARGFGAAGSYTYSRVRDVQSPSRVNQAGTALWADARALSGRHDDPRLGISLNDLPHRVVAALTYNAPWGRWPTALALYYVGESGTPFTYIATGTGRRGDLNADGSNANDPIYVPRNAADAEEIQFVAYTRQIPQAGGGTATETVSTSAQATAFDAFLERTPCLRRQRGRIMERNSCREPWSHTTSASVRQGVLLGDRLLEFELDVFNLLNLLHRRWGQARVASPRVLEHVGQVGGTVESAQPVFRYDVGRLDWETVATDSSFQLQLALRYRF